MITDMLKEIDKRRTALQERRPLSSFEIKQIREFFRSESVWASNALEGNTLTIDETRIILEDGLTVGGHSLRELHEVLGGAESYDHMFNLINSDSITEDIIKHFHFLFAQNIPDIQPGEYRNLDVIITGAEHIPPEHEKVQTLMTEFIHWYNKAKNSLHPVILAADVHIRFVGIHPFRDGNGRVARLLTNTVLLQHGLLPVVIPPIRKREYCRDLDIAHVQGDNSRFEEFIAEMELQTLTDYMRMLHIDF